MLYPCLYSNHAISCKFHTLQALLPHCPTPTLSRTLTPPPTTQACIEIEAAMNSPDPTAYVCSLPCQADGYSAPHIFGTLCLPRPWYSVLTPSLVLCAYPVLGTLCSPHLWYSVLTSSSVLCAHPILGTLCSPHPRYSVLAALYTHFIFAHPIPSTPCSPHPKYSVLTPS